MFERIFYTQFGHLAHFHLVIWRIFIWSFGAFSFWFSFSYGVIVFPPRSGFFHDEIEIPERVTILVIRLSGCLHTSRINADSVKNSTEFPSQKWGFIGFCLYNYFFNLFSQIKFRIFIRHSLCNSIIHNDSSR